MTYDELEKENEQLKQQVKSLRGAYEVAAELAVSYANRTKELENKTIKRIRSKKGDCNKKNS